MSAQQTQQKAHRTVLSKDGTAIAYDVIGKGPPLVIVNGAMAIRTYTWAQKMANELAKSFTVHNYDRRGRGDSGDTAPFSLQKEIDDVAAVCKAAGGKPSVFGMSSGACLALEAAAAGAPMAGLYAYEPPYIAADPDGKVDRDYQRNVDRLIADGRRDEAVSYFMRTVGVPGVGIAVMRLLPMWKVMRGVAHTLPYDAQAINGFEVPADRLAKSKVPTIVAAGAKTTPSLKLAAKAAAEAVPGARYEEVPKSTHAIKPAAIRPVLVRAFGQAPQAEA
jgi:pimeloyl-ACP methyl ester carboxylesterase